MKLSQKGGNFECNHNKILSIDLSNNKYLLAGRLFNNENPIFSGGEDDME